MKKEYTMNLSLIWGALCRLSIVMVLLTASLHTSAQDCDYLVGTVSFGAEGQNISDLYETRYVLTKADGEIIAITSSTEFDVFSMGFYIIYGINYKTTTSVSGLTVGDYIHNVTGDCLDISDPLPITVCEESDVCDYCFGQEVSLVSDENPMPGFETKYVLTDISGTIDSVLDSPDFGMLEPGVYIAFAVTYDTADGIMGLDRGVSIYDLDAACKDVNEGLIFGVCEALTPTILYDLNGCDITRTAILQVVEDYDSYEWSTGSTESFIVVDANTPATYSVTVRLADGCIGRRSQTVTGDEVATIGDFVWDDADNDGIQDNDENGLNGVRVRLHTDFNRDGRPDIPGFPACTTTTTNHPQTGEPGYYMFNVYKGNYIVEFGSPGGYVPTRRSQGDDAAQDSDINSTGLTGSIGVSRSQNIVDIDAGFFSASTICGRVWDDANGDGVRVDEEGIDGVTLYLYDDADTVIMTTVSMSIDGESGSYCFDGLTPGVYWIEMITPDGMIITLPDQRLDEDIDSDATGANGLGTTDDISVGRGVTIEHIDFGVYVGGMVCGIVWHEDASSENGIYNEGIDSVISNSQIDLITSRGAVVASALTDSTGAYCIHDIPRGSYQIRPLASTLTGSYAMINQGSDPLLDNDINPNTALSNSFFVAPRDTIRGINAGLISSTVPVELLVFSGRWDDGSHANVLHWETLMEINNEKFVIERAIGEGAFEAIATVLGAGTTTYRSVYDYEDSDIEVSGTYYYRLRQVDYDGGYDYSDIIAIDVELNDPVSLSIYPNPATDRITVSTTVDHSAHYRVQMYDLTGRIVYRYTSDEPLSRGANAIPIEVSDFNTGQYILHVVIGTQRIVEPILITR